MQVRHNWKRVCIKDVCESIIDCVNKTAPTVEYPTAFKMIRTTNVKNGWIDLSEVRYVSQEIFERWTRRSAPKKGDIILTREAPLGEVGMLRSNDTVFLGQRLVQYRANLNLLDNRFLLYSFQVSDLQSQIKALGSGSTVEHMRVPDAEKLSLLLPPLPTQRKIAAILSAYDDLIENNTRRIAILEEMAQSLYREWFVHFRFPGHEKKRMVESELGMIPEGWEVVKLGDVVNIYRGRSYAGTNIVLDGGLPFLNLKCIERDGGFRSDGIKRYQGPYKEAQTARDGDILMAVTDMTQERRIVARAARVPANKRGLSIFSMDLVKIVPKGEIYREYLYCMLRFSNFPDEVKQHANGVNVLHLTPERIENFVFSYAPKHLANRFSTICANIFHKCDVLHSQNANLRQTRDLLLPKLISGEVDVEGLEIETGEAMNAAEASPELVRVEEIVLAGEQATLWG